MTDLPQPAVRRIKTGVPRLGRHSLKVDMTPMTDLGFLLIAFFIMTAELSKPSTLNLFMPKDQGPPSALPNSRAMTVLLSGNNNMYYYTGSWEKAIAGNAILPADYAGKQGLRNIITAKQLQLYRLHGKTAADELMLLIKADEKASYKSLVDVLDEVVITGLKKYAVIKLSPVEALWLMAIPH